MNILSKKKRLGRPKLSRDLLRSKKIVTSFSLSEYRDIERASKNYGISAYSRDLILEGVSRKLKGGAK